MFYGREYSINDYNYPMKQTITAAVQWQKSNHPFVQDCVDSALNSARDLIRDSMDKSLPYYHLDFRSVKIKFRNSYTGMMIARPYFLNGDPGMNTIQLFQSLPMLSKVHVELSDGSNNIFAFIYIIAVITLKEKGGNNKIKNPGLMGARV